MAYTHYVELGASVWQSVRIAFDEIRPNRHSQPPDARVGAPIDVSEVTGIGIAPQSDAAGRLAVSQFVIVD